jgi:DNA-binding GntR family transcriptional regulator
MMVYQQIGHTQSFMYENLLSWAVWLLRTGEASMKPTESGVLQRIEQRPQTLRLIALDRVRDAIVEGRIAPGERLVERQLSEWLGVSRSVIREVIRNLESEGLVETNGTSGPRLAMITTDQVEQVYEIRLQLESSAAAACARRATLDTVEALQTALAEVVAAHAEHNSVGALHATTRFYELMFCASGHDIAWEIVQRLNSRISRMRALTLSSPERQKVGLVQMGRIVEAIAARDADRAARACRDHVADAAKTALDMLHS